MASLDQYESLVAVRNAELTTYWTRYNVQVVLNGGLLVAAFANGSDGRLANLPMWSVSLGGIALAIVWFVMLLQARLRFIDGTSNWSSSKKAKMQCIHYSRTSGAPD